MKNISLISLKSFASFVSFIGNPLSIGLYFGLYTLFNHEEPESLRNLPLLFSIVIILPLIAFISYNVITKRYHNFDVSNQSKRNEVYILLILLFSVLSAIIYLREYPKKALILSLGLLIYISLGFAINQKVKASMHVGITFLFSWIFFPISPIISIILFLFGFLNAWSRLKLGRHSFVDIIYGFALGNIIGILYLLAFNYFV